MDSLKEILILLIVLSFIVLFIRKEENKNSRH